MKKRNKEGKPSLIPTGPWFQFSLCLLLYHSPEVEGRRQKEKEGGTVKNERGRGEAVGGRRLRERIVWRRGNIKEDKK